MTKVKYDVISFSRWVEAVEEGYDETCLEGCRRYKRYGAVDL